MNPDSGDVVAVNNSACQTLNYSSQELTALNIFHLDFRKTEQGGTTAVQCSLRTKSGETISVEKNENTISISNKNFLVISASIESEQKHAEEATRENKDLDYSLTRTKSDFLETEKENKSETSAILKERQNFYNMLDNLPVAFHLQAPDYSVPFANKLFQERFGHPENRMCYDLMHNRKEPCETCSPFQVFDTKQTKSSIWTALDGRTYLTVVTPFSDINGDPLVMEMAIDISPQKKAEDELLQARQLLETKVKQRTTELAIANEELKRSNEALNDFSAIASHDLAEPLRKVITFGDLLKDSAKGLSDKEADYLERMQKASNKMRGFIEDLLEYSQVHLHPKPFEPVDLKIEILEVLSDLEIRMTEMAGKVEVKKLPIIDADKLQMRQLFQNLIGNSLKFHQKGVPPVVTINSHPAENGFIGITIEDNGLGFEDRFIDKIFKPFERLVGRSEYEGNGMGLAICKKIAERHNGTISVKSTPNEGSIFKILLMEKQSQMNQ